MLDGVAKTFHRGPLAALLLGDGDPHAVRAVRGLWLGMARGECFGLLGVNGAGASRRRSNCTSQRVAEVARRDPSHGCRASDLVLGLRAQARARRLAW